MATTLVDTLEVKNISPQVVIVNVKSNPSSPFFTQSGQVAIKPAASVEAENNRFDLGQIQQMQKNKVITANKFRRLVEIVVPPSSGSAS